MATKTIIFKNTTGSSITIRGKSIPASSSVDFTDYQGAHQFRFAQDVIDPLLASGGLVINNGIQDLTVNEAEIYLYDEMYYTLSVLEFEYVEDNAVSTTSGTTPQQKIRLTLTDVEAGDYLVEWGAEVRVASRGRRIHVRLQLNDTMNINNTRTNPSVNTNDWGPVSGFCKLPLTAGTHTFDLDFSSTDANRTVGIRQARIKVTRAI